MGITSGQQIFRPGMTVIQEPAEEQSVWAKVLPAIVANMANSAVSGYVQSKVQESATDREKIAQGYTKDPNTGKWMPPAAEAKELYPGVIGVMQGGKLINAMGDPKLKDPIAQLRAQAEARRAISAETSNKLKAVEAAGLGLDIQPGQDPVEALKNNQFKVYPDTKDFGDGWRGVHTGGGRYFAVKGDQEKWVDDTGAEWTKTPSGIVNKTKAAPSTEPPPLSDAQAYVEMGKYSEFGHPYKSIATDLTTVYGNLRAQEKKSPQAAKVEVDNMAKVASGYSKSYPTEDSIGQAYAKGELDKATAKSLLRYYWLGGKPLVQQEAPAPAAGQPSTVMDNLKRLVE